MDAFRGMPWYDGECVHASMHPRGGLGGEDLLRGQRRERRAQRHFRQVAGGWVDRGWALQHTARTGGMQCAYRCGARKAQPRPPASSNGAARGRLAPGIGAQRQTPPCMLGSSNNNNVRRLPDHHCMRVPRATAVATQRRCTPRTASTATYGGGGMPVLQRASPQAPRGSSRRDQPACLGACAGTGAAAAPRIHIINHRQLTK